MKRDENATIEAKVYKVYLSNEFKTGGSELRLIAWIVNGKEMPARLERRDFFVKADGERRSGKAKGFSVDDIRFVLDNQKEILETMQLISQSLYSQTTVQQAPPPAADAEEEVPFA